MWYTATSASVNTGENIVSINSGDDLSLVQESSGLIFEGESPVEVIRSYIDTGGNHKIRLASAWPYASKVNEPLIAYPTDADFAAATAELRRVLNTMEVASLTEAQEGTEDTKIMTSLKTKAAIDFNTGTAAARDVGEVAGNVMEVGAFGVGGYTNDSSSFLPDNTDLNTVTLTGFYTVPSSALNLPSAGSYTMQVIGRALTYTTQILVGRVGSANADMWIRSQNNASWGSWEKVYHTGNILGTVSQSGGVPTGAIIESGSNANGEYTKFADGTMITISNVTVTGGTTTGTGSLFRSEVTLCNLPSSFISAPAFYGLPSQGLLRWVVKSGQLTNTRADFVLVSSASNATQDETKIVAIGKWF